MATRLKWEKIERGWRTRCGRFTLTNSGVIHPTHKWRLTDWHRPDTLTGVEGAHWAVCVKTVKRGKELAQERVNQP